MVNNSAYQDIEHLYKKYGPMVLRRCRFLLKEEDKAVDAMQDVFIQLLKKKDTLHWKYPSSLLYRIATNVCLNIIRRDKKTDVPDADSLLERIAMYDDTAGKLHTQNLIDKIFSNEKESTKTIAVLHLVDGMTLEKVAEEVGMSVSGIRKRLRLLKEKVQELKEI